MKTKLRKFVFSKHFGLIIVTIIIVGLIVGLGLYYEFKDISKEHIQVIGLVVFLFLAGLVGYFLGAGSGYEKGHYEAKREDEEDWEQTRDLLDCLKDDIVQYDVPEEIKNYIYEIEEQVKQTQAFYDDW